MLTEELAAWAQVAAARAAVAAAIVALVISFFDRRSARKIAEEDRRMALKQSKLMFELDALTRLSQNLSRGGHTDRQAQEDMGAEAAALTGAIGPEKLPRNWEFHREVSRNELAKLVDDETKPKFMRLAAEAQMALHTVTEELHDLIRRGRP